MAAKKTSGENSIVKMNVNAYQRKFRPLEDAKTKAFALNAEHD
jgi:hypothetical protein